MLLVATSNVKGSYGDVGLKAEKNADSEARFPVSGREPQEPHHIAISTPRLGCRRLCVGIRELSAGHSSSRIMNETYVLFPLSLLFRQVRGARADRYFLWFNTKTRADR